MLKSAQNAASQFIKAKVPTKWRETAKLRMFGLTKIPVIFFVGPQIVSLDAERLELMIPLNRRTRNHYRSMYFGVLAVGADLACGLLAQHLSEETAEGKIGLLFKDFKAEFLKRAEGDTHFICEEGEKIRQAVAKAVKTRERQNIPVRVYAIVPTQSGTDPVAEFVLTLSLKAK